MHPLHRYLLPGLLLASTAFALPCRPPIHKRGLLDSLTSSLSDLGSSDSTNPSTDLSTGGIIDSLSNTLSDLDLSLDSIGNIAPQLDSVGNVAPSLELGDVGTVGDLNLGDLNLDLGDIGSGTSVADGGINLSDLVNDTAQFQRLLDQLGIEDVVDLSDIGQGDLTIEELAAELGVSVEDLQCALEELGEMEGRN